jgi:hypothetical protein
MLVILRNKKGYANAGHSPEQKVINYDYAGHSSEQKAMLMLAILQNERLR